MPLGHAGVGLGDQRRARRHPKDRRQEIGGADAAIRAIRDRRRVESLDKIAERRGRNAHHRAAGGVEAGGDRVGHAALARRERRRAHFLRRGHGLDPGDVGAAFAQALDLLDEDVDRLVFAQRSERSKEVARRPDGSGDDDGPPGAVSDFARDLGGQTIELTRPAFELVQHQAPAVGPETVGQDDVGTRVDERPMQAFDPIRHARRSRARANCPRSGPWRKGWCRSLRPPAAAGLRPEAIATFLVSLGGRRRASSPI